MERIGNGIKKRRKREGRSRIDGVLMGRKEEQVATEIQNLS